MSKAVLDSMAVGIHSGENHKGSFSLNKSRDVLGEG